MTELLKILEELILKNYKLERRLEYKEGELKTLKHLYTELSNKYEELKCEVKT